MVGGSLGAQVLNQTLPEAFKGLSNTAPISVWHQTGKGHLPTVEAAYKAHGLAER